MALEPQRHGGTEKQILFSHHSPLNTEHSTLNTAMNRTFDARYAQLFLDDEIIEQTVRLQRIVHQPHKSYLNPVYTVGAPWEGTDGRKAPAGRR